MKKFKYQVATLLALFPLVASAQLNVTSGLDESAEGTGLIMNPNTKQIIAGIINGLLGLLGMLFTVLMIYAGIRWMTSRGNAQQVEEAKETIKSSMIGLMIVLFSYIIVRTVLDILAKSAVNTTPT